MEGTFLGACATGDREAVVEYIHGGADTEQGLPDGTRGIHLAVIYQHPSIVKLLITAGAEVNARQESGLTALHFAAVGGWCGPITMLLDIGHANINAMDNSGMTALHHAAVGGRLKAIRLLVESGASSQIVECLGLTAFGCAVRNNKVLAVYELLMLGVNVDARDRNGRTPLHLAAELGFLEIAKILISWGADKQAVNPHGKTPREMVTGPLSWEMDRAFR